MCTVILPPGGYPIAVKKYIISYMYKLYITRKSYITYKSQICMLCTILAALYTFVVYCSYLCVLVLFTAFSRYFNSKKNSELLPFMYAGLRVKFLIFFSDFNKNLNFQERFTKFSQLSKAMENNALET
jgi:hypothetical protein